MGAFEIVATVLLGVITLLLLLILKRQKQFVPDFSNLWDGASKLLDSRAERLERHTSFEIDRVRGALGTSSKCLRDELQLSLKNFQDGQWSQQDLLQKTLKSLTDQLAQSMRELHTGVETKLERIQASNNERLEAMRQTVEEKLQGTLERRLGESFKQVSERLEQVQRGLGEMQQLALGVGDLKKVLTNVKTRGVWGEVQLGLLLEQVLTPDQYEANSQLGRKTQEIVEFAIKLPGRDSEGGMVYLPIDSKFPQESFLRLLAAEEAKDAEQLLAARKELEMAVRVAAKDIRDKYIQPPFTTDFAVMFLPTESLYAEVLRTPGLVERMQLDFRVTLAGPTTLAALLNSLQMGFRTLAIQKRSSEVWKILGGVKAEFGKFGDLLDSVQKTLQTAANKLDDASRKSRTIETKLRNVEQSPDLPQPELS
jgi:DNA recombination protein RmuC